MTQYDAFHLYDLNEQFGPRLFGPQALPLPNLGQVSEGTTT